MKLSLLKQGQSPEMPVPPRRCQATCSNRSLTTAGEHTRSSQMEKDKTCQVPTGLLSIVPSSAGSACSARLFIACLLACVLSALLSGCGVDVPYPMADVHVQILTDGSCAIERVSVACADVGARLGQRFPRHDCHILIEPDRQAKYESVGQVLRSIQSGGFVNVGFNSAPVGPQSGGTG